MKKKLNLLKYKTPLPGEVTEIIQNIFWIRLPLPFKLDHINLWLIKDSDDEKNGWTLIDTGLLQKNNKFIWKKIIKKYFKGLPLFRVICTHMHPDHIGLSKWLCDGLDEKLWKAEFWTSQAEYFSSRYYSLIGKTNNTLDENKFSSLTLDFFLNHGCDINLEEARIIDRSEFYSKMVPEIPGEYTRIIENENLTIGGQKWKTIHCSGHSPEHVSLYNDNKQLLISGDMILPKITSHVGVFPDEPRANPLRFFLDGLQKFKSLPEKTIVLPSHGSPFGASARGGIMDRINQLEQHHIERMKKIEKLCSIEKTAYELLPQIFPKKLDNHQFFFAFSELIAHLNYGVYAKILRRSEQKGIIKFVCTK